MYEIDSPLIFHQIKTFCNINAINAPINCKTSTRHSANEKKYVCMWKLSWDIQVDFL